MEQNMNEDGDSSFFSKNNIKDKTELSDMKTEDWEIRPLHSPNNQCLDCDVLLRSQMSQTFLERQSLISFVEMDDEYIVSAGRDHKINVWDAGDGHHIRRLSGHDGPVTGLWLGSFDTAFPFQTVIVSSSEDGSIRKWLLQKEEEICVYYTGNVITCMGVMNNRSSYLVVTGNSKGLIEVRHLTTGEIYSTVVGHTDPIDALVVDGDYACSAIFDDSSSLKVWQIKCEQIICIYKIEGTPEIEFSSVAICGTKIFLGAVKGQKFQVINFKTDEKALVLLGNYSCKVKHIRIWNNWIFSCSSGKKHIVLDVHRMNDYQHFGTFSCDMNQAVTVAGMEWPGCLKIVLGGSALAVLSFYFTRMEEDAKTNTKRHETSNKIQKKNKGHYTIKMCSVDERQNEFTDSDESSKSFQEKTGKPYERNFLKSNPGIYSEFTEVKTDNKSKAEEFCDDKMLSKEPDGLPEYSKPPIKQLSLNPATFLSQQRIFDDRVFQYIEEPRMAIKRLEKILDEDNKLENIEKTKTVDKPKTCTEFIDEIMKKPYNISDEDFHVEKETFSDQVKESKTVSSEIQEERPNETKQVRSPILNENNLIRETSKDLKITTVENDKKPKSDKRKYFFNNDKIRKSNKNQTKKLGHKRCEIM